MAKQKVAMLTAGGLAPCLSSAVGGLIERYSDVAPEIELVAYRSAKFGPNQEYERQQTEMMGPIIDRVSKAIEDEARAGKYDIVFDKSSRGMPSPTSGGRRPSGPGFQRNT